MSRHKMFRREDLKPDVLQFIGEEHQLTRCPACGGILAQPDCFSKFGEIAGESGSSTEMRVCAECQIVWTILFSNWNNEAGDGQIRSQYHTIWIYGQALCFCKKSIIDHLPSRIEVHRSDGHSYMYRSCPASVKNQPA